MLIYYLQIHHQNQATRKRSRRRQPTFRQRNQRHPAEIRGIPQPTEKLLRS